MCAVLIGKFPGYKRPIVSLNKFCQEAGIKGAGGAKITLGKINLVKSKQSRGR